MSDDDVTPFDYAVYGCVRAMKHAESGALKPMPLIHEGSRSYPQARPRADDIKDCTVTFEDTKTELEEIEAKLAARFKILGHVRKTLFEMNRAGKLIEDELVADWHCAMSSYLDWLRIGYV